MKGILTTVAIVAVGGAAYLLWRKKAHENEEVEIPEEEETKLNWFEVEDKQ